MLRWDRCGFHKKRAGPCQAEIVFLHLVRSVGHVVHSGVSRAQIVDALFFMLRWAQCGSHKKHDGTRHATLVVLQSVDYVVRSSACEA
jgi:hypothetical protein